MSIAVSTNKEGVTALYINDSLSSVDSIVWKEVVIIPSDEIITCYGILSADSIGLANYKNKEWIAEGSRASLKVHGSKTKQAWNKEAGKYLDTTVSKDELHLYSLLQQELDRHDECSLKGFISPWVNPYYWEFCSNPQDAPRAKKINDEIVSLSPVVGSTLLTRDEINTFKAAASSSKKAYSGGYSKGETESERLAARMNFFSTQMSEIFSFTTLYDLSGQIVAIKPGTESMLPEAILELTIAQTIELTKLILGA
jgi:hypothetical protein